jgi:acyl carrier protein
MKPYEQAVFHVLRAIAAERQPDLPPLDVNQTLTYDLGLSSLDLARAVATLEFELNADPFDRVPITSVRTVGDLCAAYHHHFNTDAEPLTRQSADDHPSSAVTRARVLPDGSAEARRQARNA